jgi:hypothetical protein
MDYHTQAVLEISQHADGGDPVDGPQGAIHSHPSFLNTDIFDGRLAVFF